jgi:hypothetical protein
MAPFPRQREPPLDGANVVDGTLDVWTFRQGIWLIRYCSLNVGHTRVRSKPSVSLLYSLGNLQELSSGRDYGRYFRHRNLDQYMRAGRDEMCHRIIR